MLNNQQNTQTYLNAFLYCCFSWPDLITKISSLQSGHTAVDYRVYFGSPGSISCLIFIQNICT